jgi:hypothetical protein
MTLTIVVPFHILLQGYQIGEYPRGNEEIIFQDNRDHDIATTCFDFRKTISLAYDFSGSEDVPGGLGDPYHSESFGMFFSPYLFPHDFSELSRN